MALLAMLLAAAVAPAAASPLNVVILDICSVRPDHFGHNGYSRPTTPALDALAKQSAVFDRAWAQSSWCRPNYATLFTGHVPEVHGQYANLPFRQLPDFETTLAEKLKEAGYRTGGFAGGVYFLPVWGLQRGFDKYQSYFSTTTATPARFSQMAGDLERWIVEDKRAPFFAYATVDDLHAPYQSAEPERFEPGYEGVVHDTQTLNVRFFRAYNGEPLDDAALPGKVAEFRGDKRHLGHLVAHYDAALADADRAIGRFLQRLKDLGLWDSTVVIVTGDHGELLGEHGRLGHTETLYEPVLRVPLLIHDPRLPQSAGKRFGDLVERLDVMPTVLDVAGASAEGLELQGESLLPVLAGRPLGRRYAFASSKRNMARPTDFTIDERAVRDARWKLHWYLYKDRYELYDLAADPGELNDVAEAHPEVVSRLSFALMSQLERSRPHGPGLPANPKGEAPLELSRPAAHD